MFDVDFVARFLSTIDMTSNPYGCWICQCQAFAVVEEGGKKRQWAPHRVAYALAYGPLEPGLVVRHLCENTSCHTYMCVNPLHLRKGTQQENVWDKAVRQLFSFEPGEIGGYEEVPEWVPPPLRKRKHIPFRDQQERP